ncbi:hypothetical protein HXX01_03865 [Candidatus Nomurabacteria bacterium]|nr:hypothetical protein [Candidatus Nomurabacteria bacterium]
MRKTLIGIIFVFVFPLFWGTSVFAGEVASSSIEKTPSKKEMRQALKDLVKDKAFLGKINPYPEGTKKGEYFNDFSKSLFSSDLIITKLVDAIFEYQGKNIDIVKLSKAWLYEKMKIGFVKLPYDDLTRYFEIYTMLLDNSETIDECAQLASGDTSDFYEIIGKLDDDVLNSWLKLVYNAVNYGLKTDEPSSLSKEQEEIAWEILFSNASKYEVSTFNRVIKNLDTSTKSESCWLGVFMFGKLQTMNGEPKKWLTHSMINSMFK